VSGPLGRAHGSAQVLENTSMYAGRFHASAWRSALSICAGALRPLLTTSRATVTFFTESTSAVSVPVE
jgi:hypothetical protein